jgi:hypothetical protein
MNVACLRYRPRHQLAIVWCCKHSKYQIAAITGFLAAAAVEIPVAMSNVLGDRHVSA